MAKRAAVAPLQGTTSMAQMDSLPSMAPFQAQLGPSGFGDSTPLGSSFSGGSYGSDEDESVALLANVDWLTLHFPSAGVENLYHQFADQSRLETIFFDALIYLSLSGFGYASVCVEILSAQDTETIRPSVVCGVAAWGGAALLLAPQAARAGCGADSVPLWPAVAAVSILFLMVPILAVLTVVELEPGATVGAHFSSLGALLTLLSALPAALLHIAFASAAPPLLLGALGFGAVTIALSDEDSRTQQALRAWVQVVVSLVVLLVLRKTELLERHQFFVVAKDLIADVVGQDEMEVLNSKTGGTMDAGPPGRLQRQSTTMRRSVLNRKSSMDSIADARRSIHINSDLEQALGQLRQSKGKDKKMNKQIDQAIKLLEKKAATHTNTVTFDWNKEIKDAGVDETVANWLKGTLGSANDTGIAGSVGRFDPRKSGQMQLPTPGGLRQRSSSIDEAEFQKLLSGTNVQLDAISTEAQSIVALALTDWSADMIRLSELTEGNCLLWVAKEILKSHGVIEACRIDEETLHAFLLKATAKYGSNSYHSSIHAADVLMSLHLFLTKHDFHLRLSKLELLAALVAAIMHDYMHPGTNNSHEVKTHSTLAITYSDQSVLEHHHLAQTFWLIQNAGYQIFKNLTVDEYKSVRSLMIELVLHTDLAKHFEFIGKLKDIAATRGHTVWAAEKKRVEAELMASEAKQVHSLGGAAQDGGGGGGRRASCSNRRASFSMAAKAPAPIEQAGAAPAKTPARGRRASVSIGAVDASKAISRMAGMPADNSAQRADAEGAEKVQPWKSPLLDVDFDIRLLLCIGIKFADLGHSLKPFEQHEAWTMRVTNEFWALGDREAKLGIPISPLCDRNTDTNVAKSQIGFFQFMCEPFYSQVAQLVDPDMAPYHQLQLNFAEWRERLAEGATKAEHEAAKKSTA